MGELKFRSWKEHAKSMMLSLRDLVERGGCGKDECWVQCEDGTQPFPLLVLVSLSGMCREAVNDLAPLDKQLTIILPHIQLGELLLFMKYLFSRDPQKLYNKEDINTLRKVGNALAIDFEFDNLQHRINSASKYIATIRLKNPFKSFHDGKENSSPRQRKMLSSRPHILKGSRTPNLKTQENSSDSPKVLTTTEPLPGSSDNTNTKQASNKLTKISVGPGPGPGVPEVREVKLIKNPGHPSTCIPLIVTKPGSAVDREGGKSAATSSHQVASKSASTTKHQVISKSAVTQQAQSIGKLRSNINQSIISLQKSPLNQGQSQSPNRSSIESTQTSKLVVNGKSVSIIKVAPAVRSAEVSSKMKSNSKVKSQSNSTPPDEDSSCESMESDTEYLCPFCDESTDQVLIHKHMKLAHTDIEHACFHCQDILKSKSELEEHIQKHPDSKWFHTCYMTDCRFVAASSYQLKIHRKSHFLETAGYNLNCKYCDKIFIKPKALEKHEKQHEIGELDKTFKCIQCPKEFSKASNLTRHIKSHFGVKSFSCDMCNLDFVDATRLKEHKWIHYEHTRFTCPVSECEQQFRHRSNLKIHMNKEHNGSTLDGEKVECNQCNRSFAFQYKLRNHLRWHKMQEESLKKKERTRETVSDSKEASVYVCASCKREFKSIEDLGIHCKEYHSIPEVSDPDEPSSKRQKNSGTFPHEATSNNATASYSLTLEQTVSGNQLFEIPVTSIPEATVVNCTVTPMDSSFAGLAVNVPVSLPVIQAAPDVLNEFEHAVQNQLSSTDIHNQLSNPHDQLETTNQAHLLSSSIHAQDQQLPGATDQAHLSNVLVQNELASSANVQGEEASVEVQNHLSHVDLPNQLRSSIISEIHGTSTYDMSQLEPVGARSHSAPDGDMPGLYMEYKACSTKNVQSDTRNDMPNLYLGYKDSSNKNLEIEHQNNMPSLYLDYKDSSGASVQLDPETQRHLQTLDNIRLENLADKSNRLGLIDEIITQEDSELISESLRMNNAGDVNMDLTMDEFDGL